MGAKTSSSGECTLIIYVVILCAAHMQKGYDLCVCVRSEAISTYSYNITQIITVDRDIFAGKIFRL